jgi:hypothetical protein
MQEQELKAYQGLKQQGAFLLSSPKFGLAVASTKQPNLTVTVPFRMPVKTIEYINREQYIPEYYTGPDIRKQQLEYSQQEIISDKLSEVIIFRRK